MSKAIRNVVPDDTVSPAQSAGGVTVSGANTPLTSSSPTQSPLSPGSAVPFPPIRLPLHLPPPPIKPTSPYRRPRPYIPLVTMEAEAQARARAVARGEALPEQIPEPKPAPEKRLDTEGKKLQARKRRRAQKQPTGIDDLLLPKGTILRLAKEGLPDRVAVHKDALLAINRAATVFISYLSHNANITNNKRRTIKIDDVLDGLKDIEFRQFIAEVQKDTDVYVSKITEHQARLRKERLDREAEALAKFMREKEARREGSGEVKGDDDDDDAEQYEEKSRDEDYGRVNAKRVKGAGGRGQEVGEEDADEDYEDEEEEKQQQQQHEVNEGDDEESELENDPNIVVVEGGVSNDDDDDDEDDEEEEDRGRSRRKDEEQDYELDDIPVEDIDRPSGMRSKGGFNSGYGDYYEYGDEGEDESQSN